jgi:hypothetical protein
VVIVPTAVSEEVTTLEARVVPVRVPAGAMTALVLAAVIKPLALTVKLGIAVEEPKLPMLLLTVAKVRVAAPGPVAVASPVRDVIAEPAPALTCACKFSKAVRIESVAVIGVLMPVTYPVNSFPVTTVEAIEVVV